VRLDYGARNACLGALAARCGWGRCLNFTNAVDAMGGRRSATATITALVARGHFCDTGSGIEIAGTKVFDPFYTTKSQWARYRRQWRHEWGCRSALASCKALAGNFAASKILTRGGCHVFCDVRIGSPRWVRRGRHEQNRSFDRCVLCPEALAPTLSLRYRSGRKQRSFVAARIVSQNGLRDSSCQNAHARARRGFTCCLS